MSSALARQLRWSPVGDSVWRASVGRHVAEITMCGAGTIGANIYVGIFAGQLAAVQGSLPKAKSEVEKHVVRELLAMEHSLSGTA